MFVGLHGVSVNLYLQTDMVGSFPQTARRQRPVRPEDKR